MSYNITSYSLEEVHRCLMEAMLYGYDYESAPRGKPIRELVGAKFTLTNPRNRIIASPARAVNYGFAVGELCWYIRGDKDLETMRYYNKRMSQFSDDGVTINSAYGNRLFKNRWGGSSGGMAPVSQFDLVVDELKRDPDSRRATMHINEPADLLRAVEKGSKDVPCTMSMQLLIRDRKLHMHVVMRSNDIVWGMPYDVFSFTSLQEAFLYRLQDDGVDVDDLGSYHHSATSLHIYDTHFDLAERVAAEPVTIGKPMAPFTLKAIEQLAHEDEPGVRLDDWADIVGSPQPSYTEDSIGWMFAQIVSHKQKRIIENLNRENNVTS